MPFLKTSAAALAVLALCGGGAVAKPYAPETMVVRLSGLDLESDAGAAIALHRIERSAVRFCGWADARDIRRSQLQKACVAGMTQAGVKTLDAPRVTSLYDARPPILLARR